MIFKKYKRFVTPLCADATCPTITARYKNISVVDMLDTQSHPKAGLVEIIKNESKSKII